MKKGAEISPCGKYRYKLWRIWDDSKPKVLFIMHNPSTADADEDDPTIRRCIGFAKSWGYGGIYVGNLSPYRATDPYELNKLGLTELMPLENWDHVQDMRSKCEIHILAHGIPVVKIRSIWTYSKKGWNYLKLTKDKFPCHPLYLKSDLIPIAF